MKQERDKREGILALTTAVVVALFLFAVAILLSIQADTSITSGQFQTQADRAQFLANAGIQDALIKLARIKTYSGTYTITETDGTVQVTVTNSATITIDSTSTVTWTGETVQWSMHAVATLNADGQVTSSSVTNQ